MIPHHHLTTEVTDHPWVPHPSGFEGCAASHDASHPVKFLRGLNELRCDVFVVGCQPTIAGKLETLQAELLSWYNRIGDLA